MGSSLNGPAAKCQDTPKSTSDKPNPAGLLDFDFLVGNGRDHHRKLREDLADSHGWAAFDGSLSMRK